MSFLCRLFCVFLIILLPFAAQAKEYGQYDANKILLVSGAGAQKKYSIDLAYLDSMLDDLSLHAGGYPPKFDSPEDRQRAERDVKALSGMLDILIIEPATRSSEVDTQLLFRAGFLNMMGHNLDIPGFAEKTDTIFLMLLKKTPDDAKSNFIYGSFLCDTSRMEKGISHLEKALAAGVVDANFSLGIAYLARHEHASALRYFEAYKQAKPGHNEDIDGIIQAIKDGNITVETTQ